MLQGNRKYAEAALKVFATLRGTDDNFDQAEETAELMRALVGSRAIPSYDELTLTR